jgi:plastocyanin
MKFVPDRLEVEAGDRVVWTNKDFLPHSVTAPAAGIESGDLRQDGRWTLTASKKGTIDYICRLHPGMKASLVVR